MEKFSPDNLEDKLCSLEFDNHFEDEQDYKRQLEEKKLNIYEPIDGDTRLHRAIQSGKQIEINALMEFYREDFDKVKDHLVTKYQWDVEDKIWLKRTILVASTEEQCQSVKNLENLQVGAEELGRAVFVLLQYPVNGEEVAVLHPSEVSRSAIVKLITTLTPNGVLSWTFVCTHGSKVTFMEVAASRGLNLVVDKLYKLGAPLTIPGHSPLIQAINNDRQETVKWLLTEHFDHFDCTLQDEFGCNALIAAMIKNVTSLFDLVLEKMMAYRLKYYNETEEEAFLEIFLLKYEYDSVTSFDYLSYDGPVLERVEMAIQKYKLKLSYQWKDFVILGRLIHYKIALDYCFEGIRNDPQLLGLKEYETMSVLQQLVTEEHLDFIREVYTKHPDVKAYLNTDSAFDVLWKAINSRSRETVQFILEQHGEFIKSDLDKLKDRVVCYQYNTKEFYETRYDLLVEFFPEFRNDIDESMAKATSDIRYYGVEGSFVNANINVTDLDKVPKPYSTIRGSNGETLLHLAVERDDKELFVRMLADGCELDALDHDGNHPVHSIKSEKMLDLIIDRHPEGRNLVQRTNSYGSSLLHRICQLYIDLDSQIVLLEKVIEYGANVNHRNVYGESAIFFAGLNHLLEVLRNHGAELDVVNKAGETALERHLGRFNVISAGYLLEHVHDKPSFKENAHKYLALLMRHNRDFFISNYHKVLLDHPESARLLFDSVYEHSREEASRLFSKACGGAVVYVSEMFLSGNYDLDYNYKHEYDSTPLIGLLSYIEEPNLHIVKQLLEKGADVQMKNCWGQDALISLVRRYRSATCYGHGLETVQLLLDYGASIHTTDAEGNTPLHLAFVDGEMELVEFLVQNGADLSAVNCHGKRPVEMVSGLNQQLVHLYT